MPGTTLCQDGIVLVDHPVQCYNREIINYANEQSEMDNTMIPHPLSGR